MRASGTVLLLQISLQRIYVSNAKTRLLTYELQAVIGEGPTKCSLCVHKLKILLTSWNCPSYPKQITAAKLKPRMENVYLRDQLVFAM